MEDKSVWIFSGAGSRFPSGVFADKGAAFAWISKNNLSGLLTEYPLGQGVYDWAVANSFFQASKEHQTKPEFIQSFTCASQEHYHFEDGTCC